MFLANKLSGAVVTSKTYSDDVFSLYNYTGGTSNNPVINNMDLSAEEGLVIIKPRTTNTGFTNDTIFLDTVRGLNALRANQLGAQEAFSAAVTAFNNNGFTVGSAGSAVNASGVKYISATFKKQKKFFDIVTYVGNGSSTLDVSHDLGAVPKLIISKALTADSSYGWSCTYIDPSEAASLDRTRAFSLESTDAPRSTDNYSSTYFNSTSFRSFVLGNRFTNAGAANTNGVNYVAYLFADDSSEDGLIRTMLFTTDSNGKATVNCGWEPQLAFIRSMSSAGNFLMLDILRGWSLAASTDSSLNLNTTDVESTSTDYGFPNPSGFEFVGAANTTYLVIAVRRPNKPPTTGTQVFAGHSGLTSVTVAGLNTNNGSPNPSDLCLVANDRSTPTTPQWMWVDRIRGYGSTGSPSINSSSSSAETTRVTSPHIRYTNGSLEFSPTTNNLVYRFARSAEVFDIATYTGNGGGKVISHNLAQPPELVLVKVLNSIASWYVYHVAIGATHRAVLNSTGGFASESTAWDNTSPSAQTFAVGASLSGAGSNYIAYLFRSKPGISKVGTYQGNGTTLSVDCGFVTGARFLLIKRSDAAGDWYIWDTARGIISGNDPHLSLNTTVAEVTTDDSVDPYSLGFTVNQVAATNINVDGAQYIYLAIA